MTINHPKTGKTTWTTRMRRLAAPAILGLALAAPLGCHARALTDGLSRDTTPPSLEIEAWINPGAEGVALDESRGQPVIVEFWSKDCPPCRDNLPKIKRIARGYEGRVRVVTVHVSLDAENPRQDEEAVRSFVEQAGISFPVGIDGSGTQWDRFEFHYLPHAVMLDAEGKVMWSGNLFVHDLERVVARAFGPPASVAGSSKAHGETSDRPGSTTVTAAAVPAPECENGVCAPR